MISDHYYDKWKWVQPPPNPWAPVVPTPTSPLPDPTVPVPQQPLLPPVLPGQSFPTLPPVHVLPSITAEELAEFRRDMKEMKELLKRAKKYDEETGQR